MFNKIIKYFLNNRLITILLLIVIIVWGISTAPFNWKSLLPRDPIPVDAIPDLGDNQQIVSTEWMGRSPKDIQEQISYPLTTSLLGIPGVKTIRSTSMFGMSFIYIIFEETVEFYWSRSRILEKLNSLPPGTLPDGVQPSLGPDATALGQIYWYTLEGRDPETGKPTGGWDPDELRTLQDFQVKYTLSAAEGVAEVASVGGFVKEYQVEVNPNALRAYNINIMDVMNAVQKSNLDIGAETVEINKVEYLVRGLGYIKQVSDLEEAVVTVRNGVPVKIKDVAFVTIGPATRRGGLDKEGVEAVGGVVVARYGSNPLHVINNVKAKIEEMESGLPQKTLADGTVSKVTVVPFYDRSGLIQETIGTLQEDLSHEILISVIVIIVILLSLKASFIVSGLLPLTVLLTFIVMRLLQIDANIVALSGIAIAVGVMVDIGVVFVENIIQHMEKPQNKGITKGDAFVNLIYKSVSEVSVPSIVAMLTTIVSFIPVFFLEAQEGKLFKPLAYTKTITLVSALALGMTIVPTLAYYVFSVSFSSKTVRTGFNILLIAGGFIWFIISGTFLVLFISLFGFSNLLAHKWKNSKTSTYISVAIALLAALYLLTSEWMPVGPHSGFLVNFIVVIVCIAVILAFFEVLISNYETIIRWCLANRWKFLTIPALTLLLGVTIWIGFDSLFGFVAKGFETVGWKSFRQTGVWQAANRTFPGMGEEFMPSLNEGSFLLMPTSMPHTGIEQNLQYIETLDKRISSIPEVEMAVGKWGRVNSALDPAPTQMFENTINYRPEFIVDEDGHRQRFKVNHDGAFVLIDQSVYNPKDGFRLIPADSLISDRRGEYFRQWRPEIRNEDDIWKEIINQSHIPGLTSAPKLQPIEARTVMLSTGMRAPMGVKVSGPDLESIEQGGKALEEALKEVPSVLPSTVFYDRAVGAPYIEIDLNRQHMARYGITVADLQEVISAAIGGMPLTTTVEGRERFPVRLRYPRELRENPDELARLIVPSATGAQIPLGELADITYTRGAQMIQSENTFLIGYVIFDKVEGKAEVDVVKEAQKVLREKTRTGELQLPKGVSYKFAGNYEQQARAAKRLSILIPACLILIILILHFQFKSFTAAFIHFSGVFVAFAGGFILLWLYGQPWFLNISFGEINLRDVFQIHPINLSIAVWVGFIALFGISTSDGVLMGSFIHDTFLERNPQTTEEIREAVVFAGLRRVRPAAMTTSVTLIALLPILTSTGRGSDIMVPMSIPTFGGMLIQTMTIFIVPVLQSMWREWAIKKHRYIKE
ncbi:MAG: efflux RND transporter permease subunit [Proteiniphilum sp.]|nr:efflux RND transporter permease subunit [Proteiniphilum sp.]